MGSRSIRPGRCAATLVVTAAIALAGCGTYRPLVVDATTGLYPTDVEVDRSAVVVFDTSVDPKRVPVVLLSTSTVNRPTVFEFMMRSVLADAGMKRAYTTAEFTAYTQDLGLVTRTAALTGEDVRRFATTIAPVFVVRADYTVVDGTRTRFTLEVDDAASGRSLLRVDHSRVAFANLDGESIRPVLNEFRRWVKASSDAKGRT